MTRTPTVHRKVVDFRDRRAVRPRMVVGTSLPTATRYLDREVSAGRTVRDTPLLPNRSRRRHPGPDQGRVRVGSGTSRIVGCRRFHDDQNCGRTP